MSLADLNDSIALQSPPGWHAISTTSAQGDLLIHAFPPEHYYEVAYITRSELVVRKIEVPEPSGLLLAGCVVLALIGRGRSNGA